jgi:hypothetical protein
MKCVPNKPGDFCPPPKILPGGVLKPNGANISNAMLRAQKVRSAAPRSLSSSCVVDGVDGLPGVVGGTGWIGPTGAIGMIGEVGLIGIIGAIGGLGNKGNTGSQGGAGQDGKNGFDGATGATGLSGEAGLSGPEGPSGSAGPRGVVGGLGVTGCTGNTGPNGPLGSLGPNGLIGDTGVTGCTGSTGPNGEVGIIGPSGIIGGAGNAGYVGNTGPNGEGGSSGPKGRNGVDEFGGSFVGMVQFFVGPPLDTYRWIVCSGQTIDSGTYPELFQMLEFVNTDGTKYLPDLSGLFMRNVNETPGFIPVVTNFGDISASQNISHSHFSTANEHFHFCNYEENNTKKQSGNKAFPDPEIFTNNMTYTLETAHISGTIEDSTNSDVEFKPYSITLRAYVKARP